jgi:soluble lytic murein transglycosylase
MINLKLLPIRSATRNILAAYLLFTSSFSGAENQLLASINHKNDASLIQSISTPLPVPTKILTPQNQNPSNELSLAQSRKTYSAAKLALQANHLTSYRKLKKQLHDYPLSVYLDFYELKRRLHRLPHEDVDAFLQDNQGTLLAKKLRKDWLSILAKKQHWQDFKNYYQVFPESTSLSCSYLEARTKTGDEMAFSEVAEIWNVGHSQPSECDSLFKAWLKSDHFTQDIAWQRFHKAMSARKTMLAKYIAKNLSSENKRYSELMLEVHGYPSRLHKQARFSESSTKMQQVILHGIRRYASRHPQEALRTWNSYQAQQEFNGTQRFSIQEYLATRLLRRGYQQDAENLIASNDPGTAESLLERVIRDALKEKDWQKTLSYIEKLPQTVQKSERWQYWWARSTEQILNAQSANDDIQLSTLSNVPDTTENIVKETLSPTQIYTDLSQQRSFYGFLAADQLGSKYHLSDTPALPENTLVKAIASRPAAMRAKELLLVGDTTNARREWLFMTKSLSVQEHIAAAELANQWGWHYNSIMSLASAKSWDDLQLRFPLAHNEHVLQTAYSQKISPLLVFAIARQESAFSANARSPAGALGLMQLMPSTAKMTAKRSGIKYNKHDLLQPEMNITLGSRYLTGLLKEFKGNRILAAAAYNAGPNRVKQWLKKSKETLSHDLWIETIPYKETRHYVQNVLAYSVIYGYRMGTVPNLISTLETHQAL